MGEQQQVEKWVPLKDVQSYLGVGRGDPKAATEKAAEILGYDLIKEENHE